MRRFLWLASVWTLLVYPNFARAQQIDIAVSGSTLYSFRPLNASQAFQPPAEKGGVYPGANALVVFSNHFGFDVEGSFRYHKAIYNDYQTYRPVLYDFNGVYQAPVSRKFNAEFMAGIGGERLLFYNEFFSCQPVNTPCAAHISSNHFMEHIGVGVRYSFWRHFFIRPEAHYYLINNNYQFHSDSVFRVGASIGYGLSRQ